MSSATPTGSVPSKSIYDTSVYINAIRNRTYYESILPHFARSLPTTYFCAVVYTANEEDFALVQRYKRFHFAVVP